MNWQQWMYNQIYRRGATRWDTSTIEIPEDLQKLMGEVHASPASRALDLGCGTGTMAIYLAQHDWQVVGVDFSSVAIQTARQKAAGITGVTFVEGDVSRIADIGVQGPFDLAYDLGCFHSLPANRRQAYVQGLAQVMRPGGLFLLLTHSGGRRFFVPGAPSMGETEVSDRFGADFTVDEARERGMGMGGRWEAALYVLHRR
jgi:SAM-dependent methyltransferase